MTIGGTDISTYGLRLLNVFNYYDLPARKKILAIPEFGTNDIKYESKKITIILFGKYADQATMATSINNFKTLLKGEVKHTIVITEHGLNFTGVFVKGISTMVRKNTIELQITIIIV
jgi:hypothetical protein